ncbi:MAG: hypothetical protein EON90_13615 [Brevundimonas sp.]|nr:MAG: hypothetical protein EON90_13615 [Brevundimonas sp.]
MTAPGKGFHPARAFCPACEAASQAKSLIFRVIVFFAYVMSEKARKPWATTDRRKAPGKNRRHAASFDRGICHRREARPPKL